MEIKKNGCTFLFFKAIAFFIIVFIIEKLVRWSIIHFTHCEAIAPFQNNYFAFSKYYLTHQNLSFELFAKPSATFRFVIYSIIGYLIFCIVAFIIARLPYLKKNSDKINTVLMYSTFVLMFLLAYFFPNKKSCIDMDTKEIVITKYHYLLLPSREYISFNSVTDIFSKYEYDNDGYNHQYIFYLTLSAKTTDGKIYQLGETELGKQGSKEEWKSSPENIKMGENAVQFLKEKIGIR